MCQTQVPTLYFRSIFQVLQQIITYKYDKKNTDIIGQAYKSIIFEIAYIPFIFWWSTFVQMSYTMY